MAAQPGQEESWKVWQQASVCGVLDMRVFCTLKAAALKSDLPVILPRLFARGEDTHRMLQPARHNLDLVDAPIAVGCRPARPTACAACCCHYFC